MLDDRLTQSPPARESDDLLIDRVVSLYRGADLRESMASIARVVAESTSADRVSVLVGGSVGHRLVATSNDSPIDRGSEDVASLESIADASNDPEKARVICLAHQRLTGCQSVTIWTLPCDHHASCGATIVLESYGEPIDAPEHFAALKKHLADGLCQAVQRDARAAKPIRTAIWHRLSGRKAALALAAIVTLTVMGSLPMRLRIPVEGRLVAARQSNVFAPAKGTVENILVDDGDTVSVGDALIVLRSPELELQRQTIASQIETSQAKLDAIAATRSGSRDPQSSADANVLQAEIAGLIQQRIAIEARLSALRITSPIDGIIDRWNLHASLASRPVAHGQFLMTVVSHADGWNAELDVPDQSMGYVADSTSPLECTIRLRSIAGQSFTGSIDRIDDVATMTIDGRSVVRANAAIEIEDLDVRNGATLTATIDTGTSTVAFVMLRSVIEWYRQQAWF